MRTTLLTLLSLAAVALAGPAAAGTAQFPIINGEQIDDDEFESAAALIASFEMVGFGTMTQVSCTGTLIAPDVVMTAGHCVDEAALGMGIFEIANLEFCVSFESDLGYMIDQEHQGNPPLPDDAVCGVGFVKHPDFNMDAMNTVDGCMEFHDIALVFLEEPITDRAHAWVPTEEEAEAIVEDLDVDVVGYGQRDPAGTMWDPVEPLRYWAATHVNEAGSHEMQIGADGTDGRKCHGDSGGPTYAEIGLGPEVERVIGVTSHAYNMTDDCNIGGVDTRVDPYLDWIDEEMREACEYGPRTECDEPGIHWAPPAEGDDDDDDDGGGGSGQGCRDCQSSVAAAGPSGLLLVLGLGLLRRRT